jgi:hypothetical protein
MLLVLASGGLAQADQPPGIAKKLVETVLESCDFMSTDFRMSPRRIAQHLGKTVRADKSGLRVAMRALPGWIATVTTQHTVKFSVPPDVVLKVADLERYLGPVTEPEGDYRARGLSSESATRNDTDDEIPANVEFARTGAKHLCSVDADTDRRQTKIGDRRVLTVEFMN